MPQIKLTPEQAAVYRAAVADMDAYGRGVVDGIKQSKQFVLNAVLALQQKQEPQLEKRTEPEG